MLIGALAKKMDVLSAKSNALATVAKKGSLLRDSNAVSALDRVNQQPSLPQHNYLAATEGFRSAAPAEAEAFVGEWANVRTEGLDDFLRHLGVGWAFRRVAVQARPTITFCWEAGALHVATRTPLGVSREALAPGLVAHADPLGWGRTVLRESSWEEGGVLVTTNHSTRRERPATIDPSRRPVVTRRWLDGETLVQEASHEGVTYRREFVRVCAARERDLRATPTGYGLA